LLAITGNPECIGAQVLVEMGISLEGLADEVIHRLPSRTGYMATPNSLSDAAQKVVDLCYDEARRLGDSYVGTEHLLLGIIRLDDGPTGYALRACNVSLVLARAAIADLHEGQRDVKVELESEPFFVRVVAFFRRILH
jgi:ATP-dependent Clp protease ATP-binding subunit ClpC